MNRADFLAALCRAPFSAGSLDRQQATERALARYDKDIAELEKRVEALEVKCQ